MLENLRNDVMVIKVRTVGTVMTMEKKSNKVHVKGTYQYSEMASFMLDYEDNTKSYSLDCFCNNRGSSTRM